MSKKIFVILLLLVPAMAITQSITPEALIEKTKAYHDPDSQWSTFKGSFNVQMTTPNASPRDSKIMIDLPNEYFKVTAKRDTTTTTYSIDKGKCSMERNGKAVDSSEAASKGMSCNRANLYKNYYTYLYGLPMKLNDPGTNLSKTVEKKTFKGKSYLVLKVTYDATVGSDVWYFYFDPNTYAMEVYQFFKTDANGKEQPNTGEYILPSDEAVINGIKMPKVRAWYYNKDDKYLGTDTLVN